MSPGVSCERDEVGGLGVVDGDAAAERPSLWRRQEALELALPETPTESTCDEDRLLLVVDPRLLERCEDGGQSIPPRVERSAGERKRGRLDDDRRPPSPRRERAQRRSGERESQRIAHRRPGVDDARRRRRWADDDVVAADRTDDDARSGKERDTPHTSRVDTVANMTAFLLTEHARA
jgi:hypothetical protein